MGQEVGIRSFEREVWARGWGKRVGKMRSVILLSFDVEEFDVPLEYGQTIAAQTQCEVSRQGLEAVLALLDRLQIRATFFTTAHFALQYPHLIAAIAQTHEVASHGFYHSSFEVADLAKSKQVLENITGQPVLGYRMARLQPVQDADIVAAGYGYNSSMNPTYLPGRYNNLGKPRSPYYSEGLLNIPVSVTPWIRFPLFWLSFKNLPLWAYQWACWVTLRRDRQINLYFHPWEFTNLHSYPLPGYIRRHSGKPMLRRLAQYLRWAKRQGQFITFSEFHQVTFARFQIQHRE
ncbi:MAG: polysaccharide deacetylase family protein [Synechococcales bacterium]|nr:polysaccharide deacetylase family protein [Synechococcales bacterium]